MPFSEDLLCSRCGYNLTGLASDGRCPECGSPVRNSQAGDRLAAADATWLWRIARGQRRIATAAILIIVLHVLFAFFADLLKTYVSPLAFDLSLPLTRLAVQAWLLVGVLELTRQDPRLTLTETGFNVRRFVRSSAVLALCLAPVTGGILSPSPGSLISLELLRVVHSVVVLLTVAGVTVYMSEFALRTPERQLAHRSKTVGIGLGITTIIYFVGKHLLPEGSLAQGFDRSVAVGMFAMLRVLLGFAVLCYLSATVYVWWSYRRLLNNQARRIELGESGQASRVAKWRGS